MICIFPFAGFSTSGELWFSKGDSLFNARQYQLAGIAYDYVAYQSTSNSLRTQALLRKADCYLARQDFAGAEQCLSRLMYYELSDSLQYEARYKSALAAYLNASFEAAESQILQARAFIADSMLVMQAMPLYALILNESGRWTEARQVLIDYVQARNIRTEEKQQLLAEIENLYTPKNIPRLKNMEKANRLSTFLPGTGQIYAGYWGEGILNVSLQAVGLGITVLGIWNKYYFTGAFLGFSFFQKFYMGGINRTAFLVNKRNYQLKQQFNKQGKALVFKVKQ